MLTLTIIAQKTHELWLGTWSKSRVNYLYKNMSSYNRAKYPF